MVMPATLEAFLAFQQSGQATQLLQGLSQGNTLQLTRLQQGGEPRHKGTVLKQELIGQQAREIKVIQSMAIVLATADRFQPANAQIGLL